MSNLQPYRQAPLTMEAEKSKPLYGLIRADKPIPPHECNVHGFWMRLFYLLTFRPIRENSLYRCPQCNTVSQLRRSSYSNKLFWTQVKPYEWESYGGQLDTVIQSESQNNE